MDGLNVNIHIEIEGEGVQTAAGTVLADDEGNVRNRIEIEPGVTLVYRSAIEKRMTLAEPEILNLTLQVLGGIQTVEWIAYHQTREGTWCRMPGWPRSRSSPAANS